MIPTRDTAAITRRGLPLLTTLALAVPCGPAAHAGRPLGTDAGTAGARTRQSETWHEVSRTSTPGATVDGKELVVSPAFGVGDTLEINVELARSLPAEGVRVHSTLALKWVDPAWQHDGLRWGFKAWRGTRHTTQSWQPEGTGASGLVSWEAGSALTLHANLGFERNHASRHTQRLANLALDWAATEHLHWIAEALSLRQQPTQFNTGARWWLSPGLLALDVTAGRSGGSEPPRHFSIGLGW